MRPRVIMAFAVAAILLGGVMLVPAAYARLSGDVESVSLSSAAAEVPARAVAAPPPPTLAVAPVKAEGMDGFFSWALLDRESGKISGAKNMAKTSSTESMIKIWLVSDYLRRLGDTEPSAERKKQASIAIRDSDDNAAESLYRLGGRDAVIDRMIKLCELTDTRPGSPTGSGSAWWSYTQMSPRDAVRLGECVKNGTAAGPKWTEWVLTEMAKVRGSTARKDQQRTRGGGRWGIIDGLPKEVLSQGPVAIKNGWTLINADGLWHLNCLAVTDDWVLAVMMRYRGGRGLDHGAGTCASVTTQLVTARPGAALKIPEPLRKS
nr:hypothetical protein [Micromonospora sp. DSM 115978]